MISMVLTDKDTALLTKLSAFLAERKQSGDGWAPVAPEEVEALYEIVEELITLKYGKDADGDLPVRVKLVDRTRYDPDHFFAIPNSMRFKTSDEYLDALDLAAGNAKMAVDKLDILTRCAKDYRRRERIVEEVTKLERAAISDADIATKLNLSLQEVKRITRRPR